MRVSRRLSGLVPAALLVLLAVFAESAKAAALGGLRLCGTALVPSLLPFSVTAQLLLLTGADRPLARLLGRPLRLLRLSPNAAGILVAGFVGGYPLGLHTLAAARRDGLLTKSEAASVSRVCNNAGPAFILGAAGLSLFSSLQIGLLLYLVQLLSAVCVAVFYAAFLPKPIPTCCDSPAPAPPLSLSAALPEAISRAVRGMLNVCGTVVFFATLCGLAAPLLHRLPTALSGLLYGALELSGGLFSLASVPRRVCFVLCSALLAWGGVCVHLQGLAALREAGLPAAPYLRAKLLQSAFAVPLAAILALLL